VRMSRDCERTYYRGRAIRVHPLQKSYLRLQNVPAIIPRLIFQAKSINLLKAYSEEILYDISPPGYFTVSSCYLFSKQSLDFVDRSSFSREQDLAQSHA